MNNSGKDKEIEIVKEKIMIIGIGIIPWIIIALRVIAYWIKKS